MVVPSEETAPEYTAVAAAMQRCGMPQAPAETQGLALGLYIGGVANPLQLWQKELYADLDPNDVLAAECRTLLDRVFAAVFVGDSGHSMHLSLFLPEGIEVSVSRLQAVRGWCQGFLYGIGLGGESLTQRLSPQAQELLRDLTEITRLDTDNVDNSSEDQSALIEIEEYLRVGVMLIRDELKGDKSA
ncbi:UPF0149 family protein [Thiosocius teredinicola]|uniref:UPF0149 family protein n=1 Tax=Thiosocius teredinicola TaxID=1973002 RepID=UPI000990C08B